jgi:molybdopterin converting factor small subunit
MPETITISVKLFAALKKYLPPKSEDETSLTLPAGATVQDAIAALNIPSDHAAMLMADDSYVERETPLTDGLQLSIFPPLAGGAR